MAGKLTVVTGPMFSGKSSYVVYMYHKLNGEKKNFAIFKPAIDTRYSNEGKIVTHDGNIVPATIISSINDLTDSDINFTDIVFDEIQFFDVLVDEFIRARLEDGVNVTACGLRNDFTGKPFNVTSSILAMADEIVSLEGKCSVCGARSTKTAKKNNNNIQIELGSSDLYEPRCYNHFNYRIKF